MDRCFATADALPVVFELLPNLDTYNALMHVLGSMRAVIHGRMESMKPSRVLGRRSMLRSLYKHGYFFVFCTK